MSGYDKLLEEYKLALAYIKRLEHQHKNDECANQMLLAEIERLKNANKNT